MRQRQSNSPPRAGGALRWRRSSSAAERDPAHKSQRSVHAARRRQRDLQSGRPLVLGSRAHSAARDFHRVAFNNSAQSTADVLQRLKVHKRCCAVVRVPNMHNRMATRMRASVKITRFGVRQRRGVAQLQRHVESHMLTEGQACTRALHAAYSERGGYTAAAVPGLRTAARCREACEEDSCAQVASDLCNASPYHGAHKTRLTPCFVRGAHRSTDSIRHSLACQPSSSAVQRADRTTRRARRLQFGQRVHRRRALSMWNRLGPSLRSPRELL